MSSNIGVGVLGFVCLLIGFNILNGTLRLSKLYKYSHEDALLKLGLAFVNLLAVLVLIAGPVLIALSWFI